MRYLSRRRKQSCIQSLGPVRLVFEHHPFRSFATQDIRRLSSVSAKSTTTFVNRAFTVCVGEVIGEIGILGCFARACIIRITLNPMDLINDKLEFKRLIEYLRVVFIVEFVKTSIEQIIEVPGRCEGQTVRIEQGNNAPLAADSGPSHNGPV